MLTLKSLVTDLNEYLSADKFIDYCPNGLQLEGKESIEKIATAVTADLQTIEKAIELKVQALIVHHGIFWNKDSYVISGSKRKKIQALLDNGISLIAYHLPLDSHSEVGNNWRAAKELGWENLEPFGKMNGIHIGVKGKFKTLPFETFIALLEGYYKHPAVWVQGGKKNVSSAALISGGAWKEIHQAALEGLDCFITGNFDEPAWPSSKEENINFLALGHTATEKIGVKALSEYLKEKHKMECVFIDTDNPF